MKVILQNDHPQWGKRGEEREVPDGFARNYLLPRKLAVMATPEEKRRWEKMRLVVKAHVEQSRQESEELRDKLEKEIFEISAKAGEKGKLFGSVTAVDIVESVQKRAGIEIDRKRIQLDPPIHQLGEYRVPVKLHSEVEVSLLVRVIPQ